MMKSSSERQQEEMKKISHNKIVQIIAFNLRSRQVSISGVDVGVTPLMSGALHLAQEEREHPLPIRRRGLMMIHNSGAFVSMY